MSLSLRKPLAKEAMRFLYGRGGMYMDGYTKTMVPRSKLYLEHVVPKSLIPRELEWDLNNLLIINREHKHHRDGTKFGDKTLDGITFCPQENKGKIARMCAHMLDKCFMLKYPISNSIVMDQALMMKWHHENPVSDHEKYVNNYIFRVQGEYNEYVDGKDIGEQMMWVFEK